jgi:hypothetical protein
MVLIVNGVTRRKNEMNNKSTIHNGHDKELEYFQAFFGNCFGIALSGRNGDWVKFHIIVEDDESWHVSHGNGSTFWFPDLTEQMRLAREWMDTNLVKGDWGYIAP